MEEEKEKQYTKRQNIIDSDEIEEDKEFKRKSLQAELNRKKYKSYKNQDLVGRTISDYFKTLLALIAILVYGQTQSGKTGTMLSIIKFMICWCNIDPDNIFIITGLSSKAWEEQNKDRFPPNLEKNIFHRNKLIKSKKSFEKAIQGKNNCLIIMDEVHIAAEVSQTISKLWKRLGFNNFNNLYKKNIKIVEFSATPNGLIDHLNKWNDETVNRSKTIYLEPGEGYTSSFELLRLERIYEFKDLCPYNKKNGYNEEEGLKNVGELSKVIFVKFTEPKYHIIRTKGGHFLDKTKEYFMKIFHEYNNDQFIDFNQYSRSDMTDINNILKRKPQNNIFIFIIEKIRCAITLNKKHLGVVYERYVASASDDVIIQGLLGRITGYDDPRTTICYTNRSSIARYATSLAQPHKALSCLNLSYSKKKDSFNCTVSGKTSKKIKNTEKPEIKVFNDFESLRLFKRNTISYGRCRKPKQNPDGFFVPNISTTFGKTIKIATTQLMNDVKKTNEWGFKPTKNKSNCSRYYAVYENDKEPKSLSNWWFVYFPVLE